MAPRQSPSPSNSGTDSAYYDSSKWRS